MANVLKFSAKLYSQSVRHVTKTFACNVKNQQLCRTFSTMRFLCSERRYSEAHEWVSMDGNVGTVGISDYAQDKLGDIAYVQLPDQDAEFDQEEECGALESVKAASEIFSPVSGKVTEVNAELEGKPALINLDCYGQGWLFKLELTKPEELDGLMDEEGYDKFLKSQDDD